jgi:hypothetical protein
MIAANVRRRGTDDGQGCPRPGSRRRWPAQGRMPQRQPPPSERRPGRQSCSARKLRPYKPPAQAGGLRVAAVRRAPCQAGLQPDIAARGAAWRATWPSFPESPGWRPGLRWVAGQRGPGTQPRCRTGLPSRPSLSRGCLRFETHPSAGQPRRLPGHGHALPSSRAHDSVGKTNFFGPDHPIPFAGAACQAPPCERQSGDIYSRTSPFPTRSSRRRGRSPPRACPP